MKLHRMKFGIGLLALLFLQFSCGESTQSQSELAGGTDTTHAVKAGTVSEPQETGYAIADTTIQVPTEKIMDLLDEMKEQLAAKEASLEQREVKVREEMKQAANLRITAWIVLIIGVVLCVGGALLIYRNTRRPDTQGTPKPKQ